ISAVLAGLVDFGLAFLLLLAVALARDVYPTANVIWLPVFILMALVTARGAECRIPGRSVCGSVSGAVLDVRIASGLLDQFVAGEVASSVRIESDGGG